MTNADEPCIPAARPFLTGDALRAALDTFPGPEQPDAAPEPALLFMSWRAALANVHGRIEDAYGLRRVWFQHAFDAGFTCAQIGEATGLSAAAVHKIIGTQRKRDLDSPVAPASPDNPETESRSE